VLLASAQGDPLQLQVFDTERGTVKKPIQTSFSLPAPLGARVIFPSLSSCGNSPSLDELIATPFYQDRSQRTLAVYFVQHGACYVINTELLFGLAREWDGRNVGWDDRGAHTIGVHFGAQGVFSQAWVSGCRLFCTISKGVDGEGREPFYLQIYGLSHPGRAKHLRTVGRANEGGGRRQVSPSVDGYKLPWNSVEFCQALSTTERDNITFWIVSPHLPSTSS